MQNNRPKNSLIYRKITITALTILIVGCATKQPQKPQQHSNIPPKEITKYQKRPPGSLFTGNPNNLFTDDKAFQVGDIITIKVIENPTGFGSASTKAKEQANLGLDFPSVTILGKQIPKQTPVASVKTASGQNYQGTGDTSRKAKLIATISARVTKVYKNGNLYIVGKKIIKINNDTQQITISGIVKPTYIQQDNSILSTQISDMYVEYNGKGYITDSQEPGWLTKILTKIWPF
ncbi:MAG: flagellar basal body L-ring protein FlgH [Aquificae bacterium]|nr:flagellar basal body L-ring protein FlgH [Aquificota bacterium]